MCTPVTVRQPTPTKLPEGLVTFLLSDIERSTEAWERSSQLMGRAVPRHYEIIGDLVTHHGGVRPEEQGEGDSVVAVFVDARDAVLAALDIQTAFVREPWPTAVPIRVRMALHAGEAHLRNESNYAGLTVIHAARLRNVAQGGQVLVSTVVKELVAGKLPSPLSLRDIGRHRLKGLAAAEHVYQLEHPDLPSDFAPSHALDATPTNLPTYLTSFLGRADEIRTLDRLLQDHRFVSVIGSGGAGKTRLADCVARELFERFPDGVWWVELAAVTDHTAVPRVVADAAQARVDDGEAVVDAIVRRLTDDTCLVVLDNAEHLGEAVGMLVTEMLQRCPRLHVVVTSRRSLDVAGEFVWRMPSLSLPPVIDSAPDGAAQQADSIRLFVERARAAGAPMDLDADGGAIVADICRKLDGMPLAIELAAARMRALAPQEILDGLIDALDLLTRGDRTALPRQQTLDGSIRWSVELLTETERSVLLQLSAIVSSFDIEAVAAVCAIDGSVGSMTRALGVVETLIDNSLVTPLGGDAVRRFALLEVVRQYGARALSDVEAGAVRERHARHFANLARRFGALSETSAEREAVMRLESDAGNIEAALIWHRDLGTPAELASFASDLAPFWNMSGATHQSETWLTCALSAMPPEPSATRARLHAYRALGRSNRGEYTGSLEDCRAAIEIASTVDDDWSVGRARWVIADAAAYGNLEQWRKLSDEAIKVLTSSQDSFAEGYARVWQSVPYLVRGQLTDGLVALAEASSKVAEVDNPSLNRSHLAWQAWGAFYSGEFDRCARLATAALAGPGFRLATQRHFVEMLSIGASLHRGLASPLKDDFERDTALAVRRGEALAVALNKQTMVGWLLFSDPAEALTAGRRVLAEMPPTYKVGVCETNLRAAWACVAIDDTQRARHHIDQAAAVGAVANWPIHLTDRLVIDSIVSINTGDVTHAASVADASVVLAERHGLRVALVHGLEAQTLVAAARNDFARVAEIIGLVSTLRQRMEYAEVFLPLSLPVSRAVRGARSVLGRETFDTCHARGSLLRVSDVTSDPTPEEGAGREPTR